ncbi:MAG TPA: hypothetical protein PLZ42_01575 [Methanothrix sp.]|nr:hypothetical protein [Methanothrix sp.]
MNGSKSSHVKNFLTLSAAVLVLLALGPANVASAGGWEKIPDLPRTINVLLADADSPGVVYAGTGLSGSGSGVYKSEDSGKNWSLASEGLAGGDVKSLAMAGGTLYAAVASGYLYASADGASHWEQLGFFGYTGFNSRLAIAKSDGNVFFVANDVRGAAVSTDGGRIWLSTEGGLPKDENDETNVQSVAIDPNDSQVVYLGTGWSGFAGNGVYRSTDRGATWCPANRGMLDYSIASLAIDPSNSQTLYAGGYEGDLFKSTDGAVTWTDLTEGIPLDEQDRSSIKEILPDPADPETVYLLSERSGLFVSPDGGSNWSVLGAPTEIERVAFTAMTVVFEPDPAVVVGIRDEGGWRRALDPPAAEDGA